MCGILGWLTTSQGEVSSKSFIEGINNLMMLSEMRGKEASGLCTITNGKVNVLKASYRARGIIQSHEYKHIMDEVAEQPHKLVMGHARMVTNGSNNRAENNQPVIRNDMICIHNGIVVNSEELWEKHCDVVRHTEVDTEIILALLEKYNYKENYIGAFHRMLNEIEGSISIAFADRTSDYLFLYTNVGSLYFVTSEGGMLLFASEKNIIERMLDKQHLKTILKATRIKQIMPGEMYSVSLKTGSISKIIDFTTSVFSKGNVDRTLAITCLSKGKNIDKTVYWTEKNITNLENSMIIDINKIHALRRCSKCLLPETFPGITFDEKGICSVCKSYVPIKPKGREAFIQKCKDNKAITSEYDCITPISGGRDSCYILHYLVNELGFHTVAYTYDWGMVTDLARRNIQRMCSNLGVEHILISADIKMKRRNIKSNVEAWLKRPSLATVPLFMAGDKQFFYYAQMLKHQMRVDNIIFGMNALEETQFKARFAGGSSGENNREKNRGKLLLNYGKEFIKNPAYFNRSMIDSMSGYLSYYALPRDYIRFFDYFNWNQNEIETTLIGKYNWETAKDSDETWRIGDGTAPFYNYIYYKLAGFTEFDTFKSNQIREGMISREQALQEIDKSNQVSLDGFMWYCETIGIDPFMAVRIINSVKPLYDKTVSGY